MSVCLCMHACVCMHVCACMCVHDCVCVCVQLKVQCLMPNVTLVMYRFVNATLPTSLRDITDK